MSREAFEAFKKKRNPKYKPTDDSMSDRSDWELWQAATAAAVPPGYVVVPESEALDAKRLDFVIDGQYFIYTAGDLFVLIAQDEDENYMELSDPQKTKRYAIDAAMLQAAKESGS